MTEVMTRSDYVMRFMTFGTLTHTTALRSCFGDAVAFWRPEAGSIHHPSGGALAE